MHLRLFDRRRRAFNLRLAETTDYTNFADPETSMDNDADLARSGSRRLAAVVRPRGSGALAIRAGDGCQPHATTAWARLRAGSGRSAVALRAGGHSMGGYMRSKSCAGAAARRQTGADRTQARPDTPDATARRRSRSRVRSRATIARCSTSCFSGWHPCGVRRYLAPTGARPGDDVGVDAFIRQQTAVISRPDSRPTLAWIKCPTLVLSGDEDNTIPNSLSVEMADGIHGAKLVILSNCGHLPQPEQPQATADALVEWLRN